MSSLHLSLELLLTQFDAPRYIDITNTGYALSTVVTAYTEWKLILVYSLYLY